MDNEKIFLDGFTTYDVPDTAPGFILGKGAIKISQMQEFLERNKQYAVDGFLYFVTKRSQKGSRYSELDLYTYNKRQTTPVTSNQTSPDALQGSPDYEKARATADSLRTENQSSQGGNNSSSPLDEKDLGVEGIPF